LDRLEDTVNPEVPDFQEPRAISVGSGELFRNPVAAHSQWLGTVRAVKYGTGAP
jgi:hypothetical protein